MWMIQWLFLLVSVVSGINSKEQTTTCGELVATENDQSFDIYPNSTLIPESYKCQWKITANKTNMNIQISVQLVQNTNHESCIYVISDSIREDTLLCALDEETSIISTAKPVTVKFSSSTASQIPSFKVHYKLTNSPPNLCGPKSYISYDTKESSFEVYTGPGDIPVNHSCSWTIEGRYQKGITVYLKPNATRSDNQCIEVSNPSSTTSRTICIGAVQERFESAGNSVLVSFPGKTLSKPIPPFDVYYKLRPSNPALCNVSEYTATETENIFALPTFEGFIPIDLVCQWTIKGVKDRHLLVYITLDGSSEQNQCVKVENRVLCAKNGENLYDSLIQPVSVVYPANENNQLVKGFKVSYKLGTPIDKSCGSTQLSASTTEKWFDVTTAQGTIPASHKCNWLISGSDKKFVEVYVKDGTSNQCVKATSTVPTETAVLCAQSDQKMLKTKNQPITVEYPGKIGMQNVSNFKVHYKLAAAGHKPWSLFTMGLLLATLQYLH